MQETNLLVVLQATVVVVPARFDKSLVDLGQIDLSLSGSEGEGSRGGSLKAGAPL